MQSNISFLTSYTSFKKPFLWNFVRGHHQLLTCIFGLFCALWTRSLMEPLRHLFWLWVVLGMIFVSMVIGLIFFLINKCISKKGKYFQLHHYIRSIIVSVTDPFISTYMNCLFKVLYQLSYLFYSCWTIQYTKSHYASVLCPVSLLHYFQLM